MFLISDYSLCFYVKKHSICKGTAFFVDMQGKINNFELWIENYDF